MEETINVSVPLRVLLPFGEPITEHSLFIDEQRSPYFENPDTRFDFDIIRTEESEGMGLSDWRGRSSL